MWRRYIITSMKNKGVSIVEVVVSMLILAVSALAVTATVSMVNSKQMRSAGGSSLDLQALSFARETLESLKNSVSTDAAVGAGRAEWLLDTSYDAAAFCQAAEGVACGVGTTYIPVGPAGANQVVNANLVLPASDLANKGAKRTYKVWDISSGTKAAGTDVAYKKVIVTVDQWAD